MSPWGQAGPRCPSCASEAMPDTAGAAPTPNTGARAARRRAWVQRLRCRSASPSGLRGSIQRTEYQGLGFAHRTIDSKPREDKTQTLSLSVYNRAVTVFGFSPRVSLINEQRETNAQLLDYERNRGERPTFMLHAGLVMWELGFGMRRREFLIGALSRDSHQRQCRSVAGAWRLSFAGRLR